MSEEISEENLNIFRNWTKEYIDLEDTISEAMKEVLVLKKRRMELERLMQNYMGHKKIENIQVSDGNIEMKVMTRLQPINKKYITTKITEKLKEIGIPEYDKMATELTKYIWENRERKEYKSLKRKKNKFRK